MNLEKMSPQEVDALAAKIVENKNAVARGEAPPHVIPLDEMKRAVASIRNQSASRLAEKPVKAKGVSSAVLDLSALGAL